MLIAHFVPGGAYDKLLEGLCQYTEKPKLVLFLSHAGQENKKYLTSKNISFYEFNFKYRTPLLIILFPELCKVLRKFKIDVIYLHSSKLFLFGFLRWFCRSTLFVPVRHHNKVHMIFKQKKGVFVDRIVSRYSPHIVAVGERVRDSILEEGGSPHKVTVIRNGISTREFRLENRKKLSALNTESVVRVLLIGRIEQQKNYEFLIEIAKMSQAYPYKFNFHVYGSGNDEYIAKLKEQIALSGVSDLIVLNNWTRNIIPVFFDYPIFLHVALDEAFPVVLMEALCAGIPIVSTDAGGSGEVLSGKVEAISGYSASVFLTKLIQVVENYGQAIELSTKVMRESLVEFDQMQMAKSYYDLGISLAGKRKVY